MRKIHLLVLAIFLILFTGLFYKPSPQLNADTLLGTLKNTHFNGAALVAAEDKVLLSQGFGYANIENQIENTPHTQFLVGSITKIFTAAAILKLVDEGKIQETLPISAYLSSEDPIWAGKPPAWIYEVTIQDLLTHSSGLEE